MIIGVIFLLLFAFILSVPLFFTVEVAVLQELDDLDIERLNDYTLYEDLSDAAYFALMEEEGNPLF